MNMDKKITILLLVLSFTISFAAGLRAQEETYKVGAATYGLKAEYMKLWSTALENHPAVESGLVDLTVFDGDYNATTQINQFQTMATQNYDGIIFVPISVEAGVAAVNIAKIHDIPVVGSNTRVDTDKQLTYIGSDDVKAGRLEAQAVVDEMGGEGDVVILEGPIGQSAQIERREGNMAVVNEYEDVEVLEMKTANWSRSEAMNTMQNWLTAHGEEIDGVIGQNSEMAIGAIQAIKDGGYNPENFATAGIDGVTDAMLAVKDGDHDADILQDARAQANGALDLLLRKLVGPDYEPKAKCWKEGDKLAGEYGMDFPDTVEEMKDNYWVPWTQITLDNVDTLLERRRALTEEM